MYDRLLKLFAEYLEKQDMLSKLTEHEKRRNLWRKRDREFLDRFSEEQLEFITAFMIEFNSYLQEQINERGGKDNAD